MPDNTTHLIVLNGWWHYRRRVPNHVADLDPRKEIKKSTKVRFVDDPQAKRASKIADKLDEANQVYWAQLLAGRHNEARQQLTLATKRAIQLGFVFQSAAEVAGLPAIEAILARIEALAPMTGPALADETSKIDRVATLGSTTALSGVMISTLPQEYKSYLSVENKKKTEDQLRKWDNRNKAACNNLITAIGEDKDILAVDRADAKKFREWWGRRITEKGMTNGGANKDIWGVGKMIRTICERDSLKDPEAFAGLGFEKDDGQREAFEPDFVRDTICNPANFNTNHEAFDAMLVMVETGARPSEIVALDATHIHLDANIPYISIREEGREVKTRSSIRDVPLVGVALEAMRRHPKGFERYHNNPDALTALVNKHLRKLQPEVNEEKGDKYLTMYGIRHCFKDRLRAVHTPDGMMDALMGHEEGSEQGNRNKPKYGNGHTLQTKLETLNKIAFS
ncbi:tyrosine-type recombinase/integrase [Bradyrhizobium sp. SZCCHNRI1002]|uniref:tyrosine-type recombinase/integrase n=1 Tax=Bradyrhizobium sp. SZCCHNRI1002 TaxID=3057274 RepID=UPI0028E9FC5B|nr:tyrosine-type recombinase/integrase [Bradyrhizobium sp. SZCCHNRI1002]